MSPRVLIVPLVLLLVSAAGADVIVTKKGKVIGLRSRSSDGEKITPDNARLYLEESDDDIVAVHYDGVVYKRGRRQEKIPFDEIVWYDFWPRSDSLDDGLDQMGIGEIGRALSAFREVVKNEDSRPMFVNEANFRIGQCYLMAGQTPRALEHYKAWSAAKSVYTPDVHRILAEIYTAKKEFDDARAEYTKLEKLPDLPESWAYRAKLGQVNVDIAMGNHEKAEAAADKLSYELRRKPELTDAMALTRALQAQAILGATKDESRLKDAQTLLEAATDLEDVSKSTRARLFATLGDVVYSMGRPEEARFPYLRVVFMYPEETGFVAHSLQNAGQCFIDLFERAGGGKDAADHLCKAMKLLGECAANYRGTPAAAEARKTYARYRKQHDELCKKKA